jgi:hypothetical protein
MPRSPYYPRRRPRIQQAVSKPPTKDVCQSRSQRGVKCFICNVDLPCVILGRYTFVQAPLGFICKAPAPGVCPLGANMAT